MLTGLLAWLGIGGAAAGIASAAALFGPMLLAGGPIGLGLAWLGAKTAKPLTKILLIGAGLALIVGTTGAFVVRYEHLVTAAEHDLPLVKAELAHERAKRSDIEAMLGCPARPIATERELGACIIAQRNDVLALQAAHARADLDAAVAEQRRFDTQTAADQVEHDQAVAAIRGAPVGDDGPVPKVLRDEWTRERARRGIK